MAYFELSLLKFPNFNADNNPLTAEGVKNLWVSTWNKLDTIELSKQAIIQDCTCNWDKILNEPEDNRWRELQYLSLRM